MLSVLTEGTLIAKPVERTSAKGTPFVTAQVRVSAEDGESVFCNVIAFSASAAEALAQLDAGDTVAVTGPAAINRWEKDGEHKVGLKVTATRVLTVYEAGMRRKAASQAQERSQGQDQGHGQDRGGSGAAARPGPPGRSGYAGRGQGPRHAEPGFDDDGPV